ncbi:hypothetical protein NBO_60g0015 [Nosema bombycis CQ1]|uniref:Uncharacterized protein n=1 Tax=Nosema bombycis (strain CQ1 / CVCC 102059) TaxID=578461 RepID=R0M6Y0_NOSB1|nr:hypothetical protein NBO_60g0015 [Nosema bombycis CQ1]|eukprot:EOB13759.1 hypothetical protein NBO_60g0015 [Nosema bombycis CQ1]
MEVYKEIFLGQDPIDLKIEKISKLFDSDEFIPHIFFDEDFLNMYIPFSTLVLNSIESNDIRVFILTSLNKFTFKTIQNEEFVLALNRVLEEDNFHNVILTLKIFASLLKINIKSGNVVSKSMSPKKPLSPKGLSPKSPHSMKPSSVSKPSPTNNKSPHSTNKPLHSTITPSVSLLDKHISVIVDLINSVFLKLDNFEESTVDTTFFTLSQIFGYVSDVIQRQPQTEKKIEGIVHRTVSFFRLFLEHRRVIDLTKYNKSFSLEMISTLSKLFKIFSDSPLFNIRNDALNSTIFELSKFSLFYCPTDAIDLRKELFYYIFKILLKNKEMYLPKIEEFFDIRFFYLDESYLINIKGLIGLTDLALVFSGNLSRRVPHELQRRTSEILESNLMMVHEKLKKCTFEDLENEDQNEEVKLNYEKSLKFHLEIVYECVNLIYKQTTIAEKFALQKAEFIDFCYKQFLLVSQVIESLKRIIKGNIREGDSKVGDGKDNVNSNISLGFNNTTSSNNSNLTTNTTTTTSTSHFSILKSTFLSLSKPLKEIADSLTALLKNNVEVSFPMADLFSAFKGVLEILEFSDFDEKDGQFVNEILLFFFTPFGGSVHLDFITGLISQMFAAPFFMKIYLSILKRVPNLQMVVTEIVYQLISMLTQEKSKIHNFKKSIYSSKRLSYPEMVDLYEPVFDFIADIYNYNPSFISKKTMYALVNFLSRMISSQDIEDHRLLLFLLGTFNVKNDKSGSLHVYFYKKLHVFVRDFFSNYMLTLDPLYLDIIFSFPININAITSEWAFLLNPIRCALRLKDDISVKAISAFIHIIEASKGEIITGGNKWQIEDLFREIYDLLDDQRFTISCSQLLGRLKSYHKNYLTGSFYYYHQVNNHVDIDHNKYVVDSSCLLLENLVLKAIEFLKGKIVFDETKTIFDMNDILIFKKTLPEVNKNLEGEEASFVIICEYINEKVRKIKLSDNECGKESDKDLCSNVVGYDNPALYNDNPPVFLYDAIISLFQCSEDLNEKVEIFLKQIYEVAPLNTNPFLSGIPPYSLNGNIFLRALLESFGESRLNLTCELFYSLLSRIPSENLTGLLKEIISYFLTIRNGKMSRAAFRGLNSILQWEKLPNLIIKEDLRRILDGLAFHMGRMGIGFSNDSLAGISALVRKSDNLNCVCSVFKWAIDRITFGKPGDKSEMVFCEETLKMLF